MLKDKVCMITGCGQGIGHAMARVFAREGATVCANEINEGSIDEYCAALSAEYGVEVLPLYFDISDKEAAKRAFAEVKDRFGGMDVLVNNAALSSNRLFEMVTREELERLFNVNVFALVEMIQMAVRQMKRRGGGSIVNFSSCVGIDGNPGQLAYAATKGAVNAITKTAAKELVKYNIRVNAIAPGYIATENTRPIREDKKRNKAILDRIPAGRWGTPDDLKGLCVFLASPASDYVTGFMYACDGGWLAR